MKYLLLVLLFNSVSWAQGLPQEKTVEESAQETIEKLQEQSSVHDVNLNGTDGLTRFYIERCHGDQSKNSAEFRSYCKKVEEQSKDVFDAFSEMNKEIDEAYEKFKKENPEATVADRSVISLVRENIKKRQDKTLELYDEACKKNPSDTAVCLSPEDKEKMVNNFQSELCSRERQHLGLDMVQLEKKKQVVMTFIQENHSTDWDKLKDTPVEQRCAALLKRDEDVYKKDPDYNPFRKISCKWSDAQPKRKIISSPGCKKSEDSKICAGYVDCTNSETNFTFTSMANCSAENCGEGDALSCAKEGGYTSEDPSEDAPEGKVILSDENPLTSGANKQ